MFVTAAGLALAVIGCGQVTPGEQSTTGAESGTPGTTIEGEPPGTPEPPISETSGTAGAPAPSPGPDATPGCELLVEPVHRLVTGQGDSEAGSAEVRRLADGVGDNALSAVASRISGLVAQPSVASSAVDEQWAQFSRLCDLD